MRYGVYLMAFVAVCFGGIQVACAVSAFRSDETTIHLMGVVFFAPFTMLAAVGTLVLEARTAKSRKASPAIVSIACLLLVSQLVILVVE